ncbi:MAG: hypothetical protein NT142_03500 [Planctomycetota bacterium]|nr:hypothetical protein [Planctomycetota bacterium]
MNDDLVTQVKFFLADSPWQHGLCRHEATFGFPVSGAGYRKARMLALNPF